MLGKYNTSKILNKIDNGNKVILERIDNTNNEIKELIKVIASK